MPSVTFEIHMRCQFCGRDLDHITGAELEKHPHGFLATIPPCPNCVVSQWGSGFDDGYTRGYGDGTVDGVNEVVGGLFYE